MHLHKGKEYFDQDQLQKAREELEAAYHLRPQDEKALNMLGMTYFKLDMLPQAEEMYVILSSNNPEIYTLHNNLGLIRLKLDKLDQARESLTRALELQPNNSKTHFYLGLLYEKKEQWQEALYHFEQAKAEKMVAKVRATIEERSAGEEALQPFEVLQVIAESSEELPVVQPVEEIVAESEAFQQPEEETTARIERADLVEAVEKRTETEPATTQDSSLAGEKIKLREVLESIRSEEVSESDEEELVEDLTPEDVEEETRVDEVELPPWEKTKPGLIPEDFVQPEVIQQMESSFFSSPQQNVEEPFFIGEEIAADISTFLAQSRTEQEEEEEIFPLEPQLVSSSSPDAVTQEVLPPGIESLEDRIPTPEEVENETPVVEQFMASEEGSVSALQEEPMEESVEEERPFEESRPASEASAVGTEFVAEIKSEMEQQSVLSQMEEPIEEMAIEENVDLEAWKEEGAVEIAAVEETEEESAEEGYLEPSPLTPSDEKPVMEQTQSMPAPAEYSHSTEDVSAEETIVASMPESLPEPQLELPQVHTPEIFQPANLDQFSRDRFYIQPLIGADRFLLIDPHLLEVIISDQLICRSGTISSYTGALHFSPWKSEYKDKIPLIQVKGSGVLFLADRRKEIFLLSLNNEVIFVESNHLLVAQSVLKVEPHLFEQRGDGNMLSVVKIFGRGTLALACQTKPLTLNVHENLPANIPAHAVIAWSGNLNSQILEDKELRKILMGPDEETMFLHFSGAGDVVVEQGSLWGDRRAKR